MAAALLPRSYLFVPGNRPERFDKALAAGADAVIVDLEDAVPAAEKDAARAAVASWLSPARPVLVRVNAMDTAHFRADLGLCRHAGVAGIVLPKAEQLDDPGLLAVLDATTKPLLPLIETARGLWDAPAIARTPRVQRLLFGSIDFQVDLGIRGDDGDQLLFFRSQLVWVSRVAGLGPPVDGVTTAIDDAALVRADTARAHRLGFGGKLCIHPRQLAPVHAGFGPDAEETAWANRVLTAAAAAGGAAVAVDGRMVDRPVIRRAEEIVAEAARRA